MSKNAESFLLGLPPRRSVATPGDKGRQLRGGANG